MGVWGLRPQRGPVLGSKRHHRSLARPRYLFCLLFACVAALLVLAAEPALARGVIRHSEPRDVMIVEKVPVSNKAANPERFLIRPDTVSDSLLVKHTLPRHGLYKGPILGGDDAGWKVPSSKHFSIAELRECASQGSGWFDVYSREDSWRPATVDEPNLSDSPIYHASEEKPNSGLFLADFRIDKGALQLGEGKPSHVGGVSGSLGTFSASPSGHSRSDEGQSNDSNPDDSRFVAPICPVGLRECRLSGFPGDAFDGLLFSLSTIAMGLGYLGAWLWGSRGKVGMGLSLITIGMCCLGFAFWLIDRFT